MKARILEQLKHGPMRIVTLCMRLGVEYREIEKHIQKLRKDGAIRFDKKAGWQISPEQDGCARAQTCDEAGLYADAADREKARAEAAEARAKELEAQCAAMREEMEHLVSAADACDREAENHQSSRSSAPMVRYINALATIRLRLSSDAGRAMLERVEALERVAEEARAIVVRPGGALDRSISALDALEAKR